MKSWRKSIQLTHPIRSVTPARNVASAAPACPPPAASAPPLPSRADLEAARHEGFEAGRLEAEKAMAAQASKRRADAGTALEGLMDTLRQAVPQVVRETERHLLQLALDIARKLVTDIPVTAEMVEVAVREALVEVEGASEVHVRVHPEDLELLKESDSKLLAPSSEGTQIRFHGASDLSRGSCLVQTRFGVIDGRRETRFELLERALLE